MKSMGIDVDIESIGDLLDVLNSKENEFAVSMLNQAEAKINEENISLFNQTISATYSIKTAHVAFSARIETSQTLEEVSVEASNKNYKLAVETYEAVGTQVRGDLGDKISKAFEGIDEILDGMNLPCDEYNKRAVRILGYNSMEISIENIELVKEKVGEVDSLVENLTPKTVAYLIANDINPMNESIVELNSKLANINESIGATNENFAKYLWNLDKNGEISETDRKKYIEMFRTIKAIGKSDAKAVGAAIKSEYQLTINNILAAAKSGKSAGKIDEKAYYTSVKVEEMHTMELVSEDDVRELVNHNIPLTYTNIENKKTLKKEAKRFENLQGWEKLYQNMDSETELRTSYEEIESEAKETLKEAMEEELPRYNSIEEAINNSELALMLNKLANQNSYYVPAMIGNELTSIHLTIESGSDMSGMHVSFANEEFGRVDMEMNYDGESLGGLIVCENEDGLSKMANIAEDFEINLKDRGINIKKISVTASQTYVHRGTKLENTSEEKISTSILFKCAKTFIGAFDTYQN